LRILPRAFDPDQLLYREDSNVLGAETQK
jgi:hypothetical protein